MAIKRYADPGMDTPAVVTHVGAVVEAPGDVYLGHDLYRRDAVVITPEGTFLTVLVSSGYPEHLRGTAEVDAPPEALAAYAEHKKGLATASYLAGSLRETLRGLTTKTKGARVKVVRGRKFPIGTVGVIRWIGETKFGVRVGLEVAGTEGLVWTAVGNVEVDVDGDDAAEAYELEAALLAARAEVEAKLAKAA